MRWFGVVRKRDGSIRINNAKQSELPTVRGFLLECFSWENGDVVLELFENATLTFSDFSSYAREYYLGERPVVQQMRSVTSTHS